MKQEFSITELAERWDVHRTTVYGWYRKELLKPSRLKGPGKIALFSRDTVEAFERANELVVVVDDRDAP